MLLYEKLLLMTFSTTLIHSFLDGVCVAFQCVCVCRLLAQWLKQPLRDRHAIAERHDVVQVILQDTAMRQALRDEHLRRIPDLQALSKKLGRKKAGLQDCYRCVTCGNFRKVTKGI